MMHIRIPPHLAIIITIDHHQQLQYRKSIEQPTGGPLATYRQGAAVTFTTF
jgi:hypothetical protein